MTSEVEISIDSLIKILDDVTFKLLAISCLSLLAIFFIVIVISVFPTITSVAIFD